MSDHLVHLAGQAVRAAHVIRQRCAWCGALIDEVDLANVAVALQPGEDPETAVDDLFVNPDGTPKDRWVGLVAIEQHGEQAAVGMIAKWAVDDPADGKIPGDSCMAFDPAVTA